MTKGSRFKLQREAMPSRYVFITERYVPMSLAGFRKMLARTGEVSTFLPRSPAHVAARLRLQAGQRRPGHAGRAALSRAQDHPAHGALHRARSRALQILLGGLATAARLCARRIPGS